MEFIKIFNIDAFSNIKPTIVHTGRGNLQIGFDYSASLKFFTTVFMLGICFTLSLQLLFEH